MGTLTIPLFPLHSVLFPGGPLSLRVFEARYIDMVSQCLKENRGFGIALINEGQEVGEAALTFDTGTLATITYWHQRPDGLLGVTVIGEQRFRILSRDVQPNQLILVTAELLPNEPEQPVPPRHVALVELLRQILEQLEQPYRKLTRRYDDAAWVGGRLAELLPIQLVQKQYLLQLNDPIERLERLQGMLEAGELS